MENKEKLRVLLQHWIDHNQGHAEEFEKWRLIANDEGASTVANHIADAITSMAKANASLSEALKDAGGPPEEHNHDHHHHHHHHDH